MLKKYGCLIFLILCPSVFSATPLTQSSGEDGPLASINGNFHQLYESRIQTLMSTFGAPQGRPVILNLGGTLIFKYQGRTEVVKISSSPFHNIKTYAHAPFSVYLILSNLENSVVNRAQLKQLQQIQIQLSEAIKQLDQTSIPLPAKKIIQSLTNKTQQFLASVILNKYCTKQALQSYFEQIRPQINQLVFIASYIELSLLDKTINRWLAQLNTEELKKLGVVIAVSHQARAQEISLQYFAKRFGFKYGEGATWEHNFVVMENNFDEKAGLAMLARHYLDRDVAAVILGDPNDLQTDLLSKAARAIVTQEIYKSNLDKINV